MADNIRVLVLKFLLDVMKKFLRYFAEAAPYMYFIWVHLYSGKASHYILFSRLASALLRSNDNDNLNSFLNKHGSLTQYFHEIRQVFENTKEI